MSELTYPTTVQQDQNEANVINMNADSDDDVKTEWKVTKKKMK